MFARAHHRRAAVEVDPNAEVAAVLADDPEISVRMARLEVAAEDDVAAEVERDFRQLTKSGSK
jgi:predicted TIM-barrel fold metal-dependent hydrolase